MNPMWKVYKSKVLKTLNPEYEEEVAEEVNTELLHLHHIVGLRRPLRNLLKGQSETSTRDPGKQFLFTSQKKTKQPLSGPCQDHDIVRIVRIQYLMWLMVNQNTTNLFGQTFFLSFFFK